MAIGSYIVTNAFKLSLCHIPVVQWLSGDNFDK